MSTSPGKHRRDRPLGRKNKNSSVTAVASAATLDLVSVQLILSQRSPGNTFFFFAFVMPNAVSVEGFS
jgi:hypothetical protein